VLRPHRQYRVRWVLRQQVVDGTRERLSDWRRALRRGMSLANESNQRDGEHHPLGFNK
jgi:hypothetical protein